MPKKAFHVSQNVLNKNFYLSPTEHKFNSMFQVVNYNNSCTILLQLTGLIIFFFILNLEMFQTEQFSQQYISVGQLSLLVCVIQQSLDCGKWSMKILFRILQKRDFCHQKFIVFTYNFQNLNSRCIRASFSYQYSLWLSYHLQRDRKKFIYIKLVNKLCTFK